MEIPTTTETKIQITRIKERATALLKKELAPVMRAEIGDMPESFAGPEGRLYNDRNRVCGYGHIGIMQCTTNKVKALRKVDLEKTADIVQKWVTVRDQIKEIKVVKPVREPVDPRTIEHTGTCPCCDRNIKLNKHGRLWDHGYVQPRTWGSAMRLGGCICVDYLPIEVSSEGLDHVIKTLEKLIETLKKSIAYFKTLDAPTDEQSVRHRLNKSHLQSAEYDIKMYRERLENWVAMPLPDGNRDHMKGKS